MSKNGDRTVLVVITAKSAANIKPIRNFPARDIQRTYVKLVPVYPPQIKQRP